MPWPKCNNTLENELLTETPIWHTYTFHRIGLWISAIFGLVAIVVSFILIFLHATHYLKPWEQKHIIRILLMVPIYAAVSFLSFYNYTHSVYFEVVRDCYEAFAIASFFSLLCHYIAADLHQQKNYFRGIRPRQWVWPMPWVQKCWGGKDGIWRTPRSGLTWFNVIWSGVFQYCFIRVFMTCVAVITEAVNLYCLESLNPAFSHVWVMVVEAIAVTIAMYCIIQFYVQLRKDIAQHKPLLKVAAIKLVIFLSFWQTLLISFLTSAGAIKATSHVQTPDIKVGVPSMLLCIEMAVFSIFHLWAFSYKPYVLNSKEYLAELAHGEESDPSVGQHYQGGFLGIKAMLDALNPWDMIKAVGRGARWLFKGRRHRENDSSYSVSRVPTNMDAFPEGPQSAGGLKPTGPTAYMGAHGPVSPKPHYPGANVGEENLGLLPHAQGFGVASGRPGERVETSPYRSENGVGYPSGDMGLSHTKDYEDVTRPDWNDPNAGRYAAPGQVLGQQESGVTGYAGGRQQDLPYFDPPPVDQKRGRRGR